MSNPASVNRLMPMDIITGLVSVVSVDHVFRELNVNGRRRTETDLLPWILDEWRLQLSYVIQYFTDRSDICDDIDYYRSR